MFNIVLFEPRIPQNTGNIGRLCVATDSVLHLVHPLGFDIDEKSVKRAGLDYWKDLKRVEWESVAAFFDAIERENIHILTTKSSNSYLASSFKKGDYLIFGREDAGVGSAIVEMYKERCFRIPMQKEARSINLATAVSAVLFEGIRQNIRSDAIILN